MKNDLDLKELERRAWLAYFQDGLWDIYLGLLMLNFYLLDVTLGGVQSTLVRYGWYFGGIGLSFLLFWLGRKYITIPRLGRVKFSPQRRARKNRLRLVMLGFFVISLLLMLLTSIASADPERWAALRPSETLLALFVGGFVGLAIAAVAYFNDFRRGYYIAAVFGLTFLALEWLQEPVIFLAGGLLVLIPGVVLFVRFLQGHPLPAREGPNAEAG